MVAVMSRAPLARLRELVARHPQFSVALAVGAVLRLVAMLGYPGALWFAGDSYVYVGAALRPTPDQSKTTGYSLFLRALLPFHSFTLVTGLQHLMGLGIAVMVYLLARRAGVSKLWATAATLPVLLDGFEIEDEHMVMAEALFTFLIMLAMLLILWRSRTSWVTALIAGLLVGYAVDRPQRRAAHPGALPGLPAVARTAVLARLAGRGGDGHRLRGAGGGLRDLVRPRAGQLHAEPGRRVLPVGPGVLLRRVLDHQAARRRAADLPVPAARPAGPRRETTSGTSGRCTTSRAGR